MRQISQTSGSASSGSQRTEPTGCSSTSKTKPPPSRRCSATRTAVSRWPLEVTLTLPAHAARVRSAISLASSFLASRTTMFIVRPLADAHAWLGTRPWVEDVDAWIGFLVLGRTGQHHAFGHAELHLARRQVGDHHGQLADQLFRLVHGLDAGEDVAQAAFTHVQGQAQQLVRTVDVLAVDDLGHAQVDLDEVVDADLWRQFFHAFRHR